MKRFLTAVMALYASAFAILAAASVDRSGSVLLEDDGGGPGNQSMGEITLMLMAWAVVGYLAIRFLRARTELSTELIVNIAVVGGSLLAVFLILV